MHFWPVATTFMKSVSKPNNFFFPHCYFVKYLNSPLGSFPLKLKTFMLHSMCNQFAAVLSHMMMEFKLGNCERRC